MAENPALDAIDALPLASKKALFQARQTLANPQATQIPPASSAPSAGNPLMIAGLAPASPNPGRDPRLIPIPGGAAPPPIPERADSRLIPMPQAAGGPNMDAARKEVARLTIPIPGPSQNKSGIAQIKSPYARIPLQILDAVGSGLFPQIAMGIPGTAAHHNLLVNQAENAERQQEEQASQDISREHSAAETAELPARAEHERAAADALLHPAPKEKPVGSTVTVNGKVMQFNPQTDRYDIEVGSAEKSAHEGLVQDKEGNIIGWTDHEGAHHALDEPGTPPAIKAIAATATAKIHPEPKETLEDRIIDEHLAKVHPGETLAAARQHTAVNPPDTTGKAEARADKSYQYHASKLDTLAKPIEDAQARMGRLQESLRQGTPQADALVAPELLTVMAGGAGSGLRMNEAEISRIVGGRSHWQDLKANIQRWSTDPRTANTITPEQRQQIHALVDAVGAKLTQKQRAIDAARDTLFESDDPKAHRKALNDLHHNLTQIDTDVHAGGGQASGGAPQLIIDVGGKRMQYKGSGATDDLKNYTEVKTGGKK